MSSTAKQIAFDAIQSALNKAPEDPALQEARSRALAFLGIDRSKSSGRVRQVLLRDSYSTDVIESVIQGLIDDDYISDQRAARRIIRRYEGSKLRSREAMEIILQEQGIAREILPDLIQELPEDRESCTSLLKHYFPYADRCNYAKIYRFLAGRGFRGEVISDTISACLGRRFEDE